MVVQRERHKKSYKAIQHSKFKGTTDYIQLCNALLVAHFHIFPSEETCEKYMIRSSFLQKRDFGMRFNLKTGSDGFIFWAISRLLSDAVVEMKGVYVSEINSIFY